MKHILLKLSPHWWFFIAYQFITATLISFFDSNYFVSVEFMVSRSIILLYLMVRLNVKPSTAKKYGIIADVIVFYVMLAFFYGETARFNIYIFPKIDPVLSNWDRYLFGFEPSIMFSEKLNSFIFSEFMYMGYLSYYLMPLASFFIMWVSRKANFERFTFIVISSYFIYFLIFIILPAEGPQFYFQPPLNQIEAQGPFGYIVKLIQKYGEAPTAAFPSSHVGIMTIILTLLFKLHKNLFKILLSFSIILLFSTVYIKAHYFVDIMAGLISAPIVLLFTKFIFLKFKTLSKTN